MAKEEIWHLYPRGPLVVVALFAILLVNLPDKATGQQRQTFLAKPKDQEVIEGTTSIIECSVAHQRGRVQWSKDGFVLGFNRTIPGYPRYEMVGDGRDGLHHLKIYNTTLVDDAAYQCQVGPAEGHTPIRATGRLTVLMAPSAMRLHSSGREGKVEVNNGDEVTLECLVENAKPVAAITWFKNDKQIYIQNQLDDIRESSLPKRHNIMSKILVKLTSSDDGSRYVCQANHSALDKPLRSSVVISVLYPPGPPHITGYTEKENIRAGEERTLTCRSRGGNPLGRVTWYRDNEVIDDTDRQSRGDSVNEYRFVVAPKDNGVTYTCEVKTKLTKKPLVASVTLTVIFPPESVEVSGPSRARVGEKVNLTCIVENTNPAAVVSWVVDDKPNKNAKSREERSGKGGSLTISTLTYTVPEINKNIMFTCHATNIPLGETKVDTFVLSVLRPPQPPEIFGYSKGVGIRIGQEQSLSCISRGGFPTATLQWYRNGIKIPSDKNNISEVSTAKITIVAEPHDNEAVYTCEAHNEAAAQPVSDSTQLLVYFPPKDVKVSVHPDNLKAGTQATLTCVAGPSNPPVQVAWYRGGFMMKGHLQKTQDAPNHGTTITDILLLNLTSVDDGLTYTCEAVNTALQTKTPVSVQLSVTYPPKFVNSPPDVVNVPVGESLVLNLTAKGNPEQISYSWTHDGLPLPKAVMEDRRRVEYATYEYNPSSIPASRPRITADGPLLHVLNVTVRNSGNYEIEATNDEGKTVAKIYINVQYPALIKDTSGSVNVPLGEDAVLECEVEGNPLQESMMKWRRSEFDFTNTEQKFGKKKAILKLFKVRRNDTGIFTCAVDNGIGADASANVSLIVEAKPIIRKSKLLSMFAAKEGRLGRLRCEADGAPEVQFAWKKNGKDLQNSFGKYHNETTKIGLVTYLSTLEIPRVTYDDYGYYDCFAFNSLGAVTSSVHFTAPTKPQPPLSLKVVNTTHDSVTLIWKPGFDGGSTQYFRLRYRTKDRSDDYGYEDVYEPGITVHTVTGLRLGTEYYFSIMSLNEFGDSDYAAEFVRALTSSEAPPTPVPSSNVGREAGGAPLPALWVVIVVLVATALLALNVSAIVCIIRRRRRKRGAGGVKKFMSPPKGILQKEPSIPLAGVSSLPSFGSDLASSKSTTNTMYAPSSYNDTVVGETLSSISEKSRESYTQDDSVGEYDDQRQKHSPSGYLIDQIEPPPEYASQTPSSQPSSAAYDPNEDDYAEVLRRNAYNHQLGKSTPRPPSRAAHYNSTSPIDCRGYNVSYSYTPSPTTIPNGAAQYHAGHVHPAVSLGIQDSSEVYPSVVAAGDPIGYDVMDAQQQSAIHSLGLDTQPPPLLGLEQHSIPSEPPSLTLDPNSITIDHPILTDLNRNGDIRGGAPTTLSTFHPNPSPSAYSEDELKGHLV